MCNEYIFLGTVTVKTCLNAMCYVNGREVVDEVVLQTGSRVILGKYHVFRFQNPEQGKQILNNYLYFYTYHLYLPPFYVYH